MKLLMSTVEALFEALPQNHRVAYWDTTLQASYSSGIPTTRYTIRVTGLIHLADQPTLAEVTIRCSGHAGEAHDEIDQAGKEKVAEYKEKPL